MTGQDPVELIGEFSSISLVKRRRATSELTAGPHCVEKIPDIETRFYIVLGKQFTAGAKRLAALLYDLCCERDITCYNQIILLESIDDLVICNIQSCRHLEKADTA